MDKAIEKIVEVELRVDHLCGIKDKHTHLTPLGAAQILNTLEELGYRLPPDRPKKVIRSEDCPIYLKSQGKKWNPYITPDQYPCEKCPLDCKERKQKKLDRPELREKIVKILTMAEHKEYNDRGNVFVDAALSIQQVSSMTDQLIALIPAPPEEDMPRVICLCGSTRFVDTFNEWRKTLTLEGKIVLGIELVIPQAEREDPQHSNYAVKQMLDELHLRKIDLSDEVMVLNVNGYIGESTAKEIQYAESKSKPIKYLEPTPS